MSTVELSDNATHEEIQATVDQIIKDDKGEPEEKGDAQRLAEDHDETATQLRDTASDGEGPAKADDDTGGSDSQEDGDADWLDDDLKAEVAAYGIDEKELVEFTSREELQRALGIFDRTAMEAGRKALAKGEEAKTQPPEEEPKPKSNAKEGTFEVAFNEDEVDEGIVAEVKRLNDHYESRLDAMEARFAEADTRMEHQKFDSLVDTLGCADLFGKTGSESPKELQRREDLLVASKAQQIGLQMLGRDVAMDGSLVARVNRMVFGDELSKKDLKARTRKMSKQANGKMGSGGTKSPNLPQTLEEKMVDRYKELDGK